MEHTNCFHKLKYKYITTKKKKNIAEKTEQKTKINK